VRASSTGSFAWQRHAPALPSVSVFIRCGTAKDRYLGHPEPAPAQAGVLLGHKKLDTTALYTRVAINAIGEVTSLLDLLLKIPG
jgi:hypothetical protein